LNAIREETNSELAGRLWKQAPKSGMDWTARAGFRLLYERPESMSPEMPETAPLIPWY
jgi:hypothetical protein